MAIQLGAKNSSLRKTVYDQVVGPLNALARVQGLTSTQGKIAWTGMNHTQVTAEYKKAREIARDLTTLMGGSFNMATSMSTFNKAKGVVASLQTALKASTSADLADVAQAEDSTAAGDPEMLSVESAPTGEVDWSGLADSGGGGTAEAGLAGLSTAVKIGIGIGAGAVVLGGIALGVKLLRSRTAA